MIRRACLPRGGSKTWSTRPIYAVAVCRACLHGDKRFIQPARSKGYCVFHDPQLLSTCDESDMAPCVTMPWSSVKCLNVYDASLLVMSDHHCKHCNTHSECFSLSENGSRQLVIHVIAGHSNLYVIADLSPNSQYASWQFYDSSQGEQSLNS